MSFGAGRLQCLEDVASEGISLSYASQVMSWKGLPFMPAHGIPVSARFALTRVAWYLATASAHSLPTISAWDLTLNRCTGFDELQIICTSIFKISPCTWWRWSLGLQQVLPDLVERREAFTGHMWVAVKNGGCDSSQFSSVDGAWITHIRFNKAGRRGSKVVCACTCHLYYTVSLDKSGSCHLCMPKNSP